MHLWPIPFSYSYIFKYFCLFLNIKVLISPPDMRQRQEILQSHTSVMPLEDGLDLAAIATITNGYVGADLAAVTHEASYMALAEGTMVCCSSYF